MQVAFTKTGNVGARPNQILSAKTSKQKRHIAHIPEGTGFTLCGRVVDRVAEVDEDASVEPCQVCTKRLRNIERDHPARANRFLVGNPQLPGPII